MKGIVMNNSIKPIEKVATQGLLEPVSIVMDGNLLEMFNNTLNAMYPYNNSSYKRTVWFAQDKGTHTFTAHFHDNTRDYRLTLESNWVGMRNRNY